MYPNTDISTTTNNKLINKTIMNKQSFPIPEGCKAITVEQVGNQIITTFEPVFKRGDVLIAKETSDTYESILIYHSHNGSFINSIVGIYVGAIIFDGVHDAKYRHATSEEAQPLWDALAESGKCWNPETMQVEEIKKERWIAEIGEKYYYINSSLHTEFSSEVNHDVDYTRYRKGNYFQTEEQAQRAANRLQVELNKFWEEELK